MLTATRHSDRGFTLVEMMFVVGLLGIVLGVIYGAVQVLTTSAATSMEESASAHDLSYSMELLSKALMAGTEVTYADGYRLDMKTTQNADGSYELQSIYATIPPNPTSTSDTTAGLLVWTRSLLNADGTAIGGNPTFNWVVSDRNMNAVDRKPLFTYYAQNDTTMTVVPGVHVTRIHLYVSVLFNKGRRDDSRDVVPPMLR